MFTLPHNHLLLLLLLHPKTNKIIWLFLFLFFCLSCSWFVSPINSTFEILTMLQSQSLHSKKNIKWWTYYLCLSYYFLNCYSFLTVPSIFHRSIVSVLFAYCIRAHQTNNTHKAFEAFALHLIQPVYVLHMLIWFHFYFLILPFLLVNKIHSGSTCMLNHEYQQSTNISYKLLIGAKNT